VDETSEEYKARLRGYVGRRDAVKVLRETPSVLRKLILRQPPGLLARRPRPGKWSVVEILAHLADVELVLGYRLRCVLANPGKPIQNIDQNRWAEVMRYRGIAPWKSIMRFRDTRQWNLELLAGLTAREWSRYGIHTERGRESVRDTVRLYAGHDLNHAGQITSALLAGGSAP
jgi:hypothetical protein